MRKTQMNKTQKTAVVGGTVLAIAVGGVAFAAWTSTGTGSGSVTAGSAKNLVVTGSTATDLYPSESKTISFTVKNENSYAVKLSSLAPTVSVSGGAGCTVANSLVTAATQAFDASAQRIASNGTTVVPVTVSMGADADNGCQGATFTISATATAASVA